MDAEPVLVLLPPCLPLALGRKVAGKLFFLYQTGGADVFSCPNLAAKRAAEFQRDYPILEILTAVVCCLCPMHFPSSIFVIVRG